MQPFDRRRPGSHLETRPCIANGSLQVQHTLFDLLRPALIPKLRADITAGTPRHIHLILITQFGHSHKSFP